MSAPIFAPFVMDGVSKAEKSEPERTRHAYYAVGPQQQPRGRVVSGSSSSRLPSAPRQRYRVIQPVAKNVAIANNLMDNRTRRPKTGVGLCEPIGKLNVTGNFSKVVSIIPTRTKRRNFYDDGDDETLAQRILAERDPSSLDPPPKLARKLEEEKPASSSRLYVDDMVDNMHHQHDLPVRFVGSHEEVPTSVGGPVPSSSAHQLVAKQQEEYEEEVDIDTLEDAPQLSPNGMRSAREQLDDLRGASLRDGGTVGGYAHISHITKMRATTQAVKQLNGENSYLKDQLDACYYRIKQLETMLMDRNARLRQLLSENLRMSAKMKRLIKEIGEDAAAEVLAGN